MNPKPQNTIVENAVAHPYDRFIQRLKTLEAKALPELLSNHNINPAKFALVIQQQVKNNTSLLNAFIQNPTSMMASLLFAAEIGLIPNSITGEFYFIPRKINGILTVTPLIGYKGWLNLLYRNKEISTITAQCVFKQDKFEAKFGIENTLIHEPNFDVIKSSENFKLAYAVAKMKSGDFSFEVLTKRDIEKIRDLSIGEVNKLYFNDKKDPNMWMEKKCALVQLAKSLPKDYYATQALAIDQAVEGGAYLTVGEDNRPVLKDEDVSKLKQANVINTFNALPEPPQTIDVNKMPVNTEKAESKPAQETSKPKTNDKLIVKQKTKP